MRLKSARAEVHFRFHETDNFEAGSACRLLKDTPMANGWWVLPSAACGLSLWVCLGWMVSQAV